MFVGLLMCRSVCTAHNCKFYKISHKPVTEKYVLFCNALMTFAVFQIATFKLQTIEKSKTSPLKRLLSVLRFQLPVLTLSRNGFSAIKTCLLRFLHMPYNRCSFVMLKVLTDTSGFGAP